jgi:hypothetical protein
MGYVGTILIPRSPCRKDYQTRAKLSKLQSLACLGITGAITMAPTAATEVLLGLLPLHLKMEDESEFIDSVAMNSGSPDPYGMGMRRKSGT